MRAQPTGAVCGLGKRGFCAGEIALLVRLGMVELAALTAHVLRIPWDRAQRVVAFRADRNPLARRGGNELDWSLSLDCPACAGAGSPGGIRERPESGLRRRPRLAGERLQHARLIVVGWRAGSELRRVVTGVPGHVPGGLVIALCRVRRVVGLRFRRCLAVPYLRAQPGPAVDCGGGHG